MSFFIEERNELMRDILGTEIHWEPAESGSWGGCFQLGGKVLVVLVENRWSVSVDSGLKKSSFVAGRGRG